jgi:large subunit ribosomal protein L5
LEALHQTKKQIEAAQQEMTMITGQKAMLTHATKDISNFKLRKGMPVGVMVTLRGNQMYEFLDRLVTSTMPRIRDFNGISEKGFDGRGNYTMGIKEQIAFPEISIDKISKITGMDITFVTNTNSDNEALAVLKELGLPFKQNDKAEKLRELEIEQLKELKIKEAEETAESETVIEEKNTNNQESDNNQDSSEESDKTES